MPTYTVIRKYFNSRDYGPDVIATGLTLKQAQKHCNNPETSYKTCKLPENVARTEKCGIWFDGYTEE